MSLSKMFLQGRLTRDLELKYLTSGAACGKFSVAVDYTWKDRDGNKKKETSFFNCVLWGKSAEGLAQYLTKGKEILVEGRPVNRSYEKDGQKRTIFEVNVDQVHFTSGGKREDNQGDQGSHGYSDGYQAPDDDGDVPF